MPFRILIVDDSMAMRKILQRVIRQAGFEQAEFLEAPNGAEGLKLFDPHSVDLILSDWNMPGMDGITFVQEARKKNRETVGTKIVPIIMITSEGGAAKFKEARLAGANNFISKPFTPEVFEQKIKETIVEQGARP